ncbi:hypothetical protein FV232_27050 [Methylobacterium sp. WL30]|uniref:DUF6883 domain-containing protein n=1 Tax=unclassified Methylobacterium TaxID=2615210 RepID=UPI0011C7CDB7|nr:MULTISPECIES: DUF6883 domain-containing protein [unclassified Methylobacterium]MCJ2009865.1 hypothetical protein [Methylobacterium sp. J-092]MCJ2074510.1 hypothetical protein [Methylobacterium sp. E-016]TXN40665.1 hypothetical protein FV225_05315 [Methylobacterium sp. WL93]TXN49989.1 hypothetical protein FV227_14000 [Methylobacterium sp. WL119]TXN61480.1 hypothetical protein FV232_27050 [Methylobacterium sp. WL30]
MSSDEVEVSWLIDRPKISRYLLDLTSKRGASKAKYLMRFGFTPDDPLTLANALAEHVARNLPGVQSISARGVLLVVFEGEVTAPDGREMPLRTVWEPREPRQMHFVTAVPLTR